MVALMVDPQSLVNNKHTGIHFAGFGNNHELYICSIYIHYYIFGPRPLDGRGFLLGWGGLGHVLTFM